MAHSVCPEIKELLLRTSSAADWWAGTEPGSSGSRCCRRPRQGLGLRRRTSVVLVTVSLARQMASARTEASRCWGAAWRAAGTSLQVGARPSFPVSPGSGGQLGLGGDPVAWSWASRGVSGLGGGQAWPDRPRPSRSVSEWGAGCPPPACFSCAPPGTWPSVCEGARLCECVCMSVSPRPRTVTYGSHFGFKLHLLDDCACKGETGEKEQSVPGKPVTELGPTGLIPPGGKTQVMITCDAKYVAGRFAVSLLGGRGTFAFLGKCAPGLDVIKSVCSFFFFFPPRRGLLFSYTYAVNS